MPKVVHIITELRVGGAENALHKIILHSDRDAFDYVVISLEDKGVFGEPIKSLGVPVYTLNMNPARPNPLALLSLIRILRREKPDIIHLWLYHAILAGTLASFFVPNHALGWNIRNATIKNFGSGSRRLIFNLCARLSGRADFIVTNTKAGERLHIDEGYRDGHWHILYNGFELDRFQPDTGTRDRMRAELGLSEDASVIGMVGRLTPEKNYPGFISAALKLLETHADVYFVAVGKDVTFNSLGDRIPQDKQNRFRLLDMRRDIPDLLNAFDLFTLTSDFEGFPNVVGEAMATGLPVAVTNAGDTAHLVGDAGIVVPTGDMDAMVAAWARLIAMSPQGRAAMGASARERIIEQFSVEKFTEQYASLYQKILTEKQA